VVVVRTLVAVLIAVMLAPKTAKWLGSVTVPEMLPPTPARKGCKDSNVNKIAPAALVFASHARPVRFDMVQSVPLSSLANQPGKHLTSGTVGAKVNTWFFCRAIGGTLCTMKKRQGGGGPAREPLTDLERDVMQAVWDAGPCSVGAVHRIVSEKRDLKEATVRTLLRRLEQKGCLWHATEARAYIYGATEPSRNLAARAVRQIIDRFCRGSLEELVSGMVDAKVLSEQEMASLRDLVKGSVQESE
jgi:BlaI family transcriptional regulator, penicillinase repressor